MLDVRRNGHAFVMAFSPSFGFGVDELLAEEPLGNHYRFTCSDFDAAARKLRALLESPSKLDSPLVSLLVLQAKEIESTREFYSLLGLDFVAEKHGPGPRHYAATLGSLVFEIYPCGTEPVSPTRFGFRVTELDATLNLLRQHAAKIISEPKPTPWGRRAVVEDPDGNRVELLGAV